MPESFEKYLSAIRHYCGYRERCHEEVRYKLVELGARGEELEQLIEAMINANMLNEERYAKAYSRGKFRINKWGRSKIILGLKKKKVSEYCIRKGLQEIDDVEYENILHLLAKEKWEELKKEKHPVARKQKVIRYLVQKGFEYTLATEALKQIHNS